MYAGGDKNQEYLSYKIGCETKKLFDQHRLWYERKGTQTECLQKGYQIGTRHLYHFEPSREEEENEDFIVVDEVPGTRGVFNALDITANAYDNAYVSIPTIILEESKQIVFQVVKNEDGEEILLSDAIAMLEECQGTDQNTYFFGLLRQEQVLDRFVMRERQYKFLEESFSQQRIQKVFSEGDLLHMFQLAQAKGRLLFFLPSISTHLVRQEDSYVCCEIDFNGTHIIFYHNEVDLNQLLWYRRIMIQQFVLPGTTTWQVYHMPLLTRDNQDLLLTLMLIAIARLQNFGFQKTAMEVLPNKLQRIMYVLHQLHTTFLAEVEE